MRNVVQIHGKNYLSHDKEAWSFRVHPYSTSNIFDGRTGYDNKKSLGEGTDYDNGKGYVHGNCTLDVICGMSVAN